MIRSNITQSGLGGSELVIGAEEYFNPQNGRMSSQHTLNTPVDTPIPHDTPTQKFFPPGMTLPADMSHRNSQNFSGNNRHSRFGSQQIPTTDGFSTLGSRSRHGSTMFPLSAVPSCNPLGKMIFFFFRNYFVCLFWQICSNENSFHLIFLFST